VNVKQGAKQILFLLALAGAGYYATVGEHGVFALIKIKRLCHEQQQRIFAMEKEIAWLKAENKAWLENPFKQEEFARLELGMGYTNEFMYQIK